MKRWLLAAALVILPAWLMAQTLETLNPGQPFSVQADHTDATDRTTKQLVPVDGYRLRQNGTVAITLPFSARDAQGHVTFAFPSGWPAGVYDILVTAYNVIDGVTNESPLPSSTANIRLTVGSPPPPPPPPPAPPPPPPPPPGEGCGWAISPSTLTVPAAGGSFNGSLTAATTCAWTVYSTSAWITVGSTVKGTGPLNHSIYRDHEYCHSGTRGECHRGGWRDGVDGDEYRHPSSRGRRCAATPTAHAMR